MSRKIFMIAGEASGDVLGGSLIKALKAGGDVEITGIGGPVMKKQGLKTLLPMEKLSVMGLWEVIGHLPRLMKIARGLVEEIEKSGAETVVTVDLPDFNFYVARLLKKRGKSRAKIIHYVAPTVWAWRPGRSKRIAAYLDGLMCLFPFEPPYFEPHGLKTVCVGHPLVENSSDRADGAAFRARNDIDEQARVLGLFFGSRKAELSRMGRVFEETVSMLREQFDNLHLIVLTLPHLEYELLRFTQGWRLPISLVTDPEKKWNVFAACDTALAVSGTVGLELAYMGVPHVIAYKMNPVTWQIVKRVVKIKYAHLANILLNKPAVPEYLQKKCNSLDIARGLLTLMKREEARQAQISDFERIPSLLGADDPKTPSEKAADFILNF